MKTQWSGCLRDSIAEHGLRTAFHELPNVSTESIDSMNAQLVGQIVDAHHVVADGVSDYLFDTNARRQSWEAAAFPALIPPFDSLFIEGRVDRGGGRIGVLVDWLPADAPVSRLLFPDAAPRAFGVLHLQTVIAATRQRPLSLWSPVALVVDDMGHSLSLPRPLFDPDLDGAACRVTRDGMFLALTTIAFMNCRNATTSVAEPPNKINAARAKRGKPPFCSQRTIDIRPMKVVLRHEGMSERIGVPSAMHICRGHFKDYRRGGGLFGRTKGLFWWEAHGRGDEALGVIEKTYRVHAPEVQP